MGTDSMIPTEICERIAEDTDALVGPPINYGASDMHAGYEGITYLPTGHLQRLSETWHTH